MSIRITGDKTGLRRTTNLPDSHAAFAIVGFAKLLDAEPARIATLAYTQNTDGSQSQTAVLGGATGDGLRAGDQYGGSLSSILATIAAGGAAGENWFYFSIEGVGSGANGMRVYYAPIGGTPTFVAHTNTAGATGFAAIQLGDLPYGTLGWFDGLLAHVTVYNRALTAEEHEAQAAQGPSVSTVGRLSYHSFEDDDIEAALVPDAGAGAFESFTSDPSTSADMPVFEIVPTLIIEDTLPAYSAATVEPEWGSVGTQAAFLGAPFSFVPPLLAGTTPITYSKLAGPAWATVNPTTRAITGSPTGLPVLTSVTVRADNGIGDPADLVVPINVTAVPLTIATPSVLPAGSVGTAYNQRILVAGGVAPYTFAITAGAPPAGTDRSVDFIIGTPSLQQIATFDFTVTDAAGASATRTFTIAIAAPITAPPGGLVAAPASLTLSQAAGPVSVLIQDAQGGALSSLRSRAARAEVSKPGYVAVSRYFVSGQMVVTPVARGSGTITVVYGDQVNDERSCVIPFTVTA